MSVLFPKAAVNVADVSEGIFAAYFACVNNPLGHFYNHKVSGKKCQWQWQYLYLPWLRVQHTELILCVAVLTKEPRKVGILKQLLEFWWPQLCQCKCAFNDSRHKTCVAILATHKLVYFVRHDILQNHIQHNSRNCDTLPNDIWHQQYVIMPVSICWVSWCNFRHCIAHCFDINICDLYCKHITIIIWWCW